MTDWIKLVSDGEPPPDYSGLIEIGKRMHEAMIAATRIPPEYLWGFAQPSSYALAKAMQPRIGGKEASFVAIDEAQEFSRRANGQSNWGDAFGHLAALGIWGRDSYRHGMAMDVAEAVSIGVRRRRAMTAEDVVQAVGMLNLRGETIEVIVHRLCNKVRSGLLPLPGTKGGAMEDGRLTADMALMEEYLGKEATRRYEPRNAAAVAVAVDEAFRDRTNVSEGDVVRLLDGASAAMTMQEAAIAVIHAVCSGRILPHPRRRPEPAPMATDTGEGRKLCEALGVPFDPIRSVDVRTLLALNEQVRQMMMAAEIVGPQLGITRDRWRTLPEFMAALDAPIRGLQATIEALRNRAPPTCEEAIIDALENLVEGDEDYHELFPGYEGAEGSLYDCAPQRTVFSAHVEIIREDDAENDYPFSVSVIPMDPPAMTDEDRAVAKAEDISPWAALAARRRHLTKAHARKVQQQIVDSIEVQVWTPGEDEAKPSYQRGEDLPPERGERTTPPGRPIGLDLPGSWPDED